MSLLKNLGNGLMNLVLEEDPNKTPQTDKVVQQAVTPPMYVASPQVNIQQSVEYTQEEYEKFNTHFVEFFKGLNLPGPDYYEMSKIMDDMEKNIPDETTRIISSFYALKTNGLTKAKLLESIDLYLTKLSEHKNNFLADANTKISNTEAEKTNEINRLVVENQAKQQQITDIQKTIFENDQKISTLNLDIAESKNKIIRRLSVFETVYNALINRIKKDKENISTKIPAE